MTTVSSRSQRLWRVLGLALALAATAIVAPSPTASAQATPATPAGGLRAFPFDEGDCGPPSTAIPGPPPELIVVGQPMSDYINNCQQEILPTP